MNYARSPEPSGYLPRHLDIMANPSSRKIRGLPLIDTDVIIRLLTGDDLEKQARARGLFKRIEAGEVIVFAPITTIADCVYVLSSPSLYKLPRAEVVGLLLPILRLRGFRMQDRRAVLKALDLFAATTLDFGDAYLAASMERLRSRTVYSFDRAFDRIKEIQRLA
ncbi:MAG: type II toxin-antitoxin system VapC family toxin [Chloroflexi bacterium]|nr:type II toxin-antitoxin system VapC family toxin [Chloroflexota bacterium]